MPWRLLLLAAAALLPISAAEEAYPWFKRAGNHKGGSVSFVVPSNFSEAPTWSWPNEGDELFRHGPVIDSAKNIYAITSWGWVRKFSPDGELLWAWRTEWADGKIVTSPYLYEGKLFFTSKGQGFAAQHWLWCVDMETGKVIYKVPGPRYYTNDDSHTVNVAEGVILGAMISEPHEWEGNDRIYALNATDGSNLWHYQLDDDGVVWNFMPSTPGDGTAFFSTCCGKAYRLRLKDGEVLWKGPVVQRMKGSCGTGGGVLGPNGVFYVVANYFHQPGEAGPLPGIAPCSIEGCEEGVGLLLAHEADDGKVLWARRIKKGYGGFQYPTIGTIDGRLTLVAGIGTNPALATVGMGPNFLPFWVRIGLQFLQASSWLVRRLLMIPIKVNGVAAYDPQTGKDIWFWEEEPWEHHAAEGDGEFFLSRATRLMEANDARAEPMCGPDNFGIPSVTGDGTVLIASGSRARLYAIRDANSDNVIEDSEVSTYESGAAYLNNPALAPGMVAAAPCWGPMNVWRSKVE